MRFEEEFAEGIRLGVQRARLKLENRDIVLSEQGQQLIRDSMERFPDELSGRFVELFAEMATIAVVTRAEYEEPDLTAENFDEFLGHSIFFMNSFRHREIENDEVPGANSNSGSNILSPAAMT